MTDEPTRAEPAVEETLLHCVEALLQASDRPLSVEQIARLLSAERSVAITELRIALDALGNRYAESAVDLVEVAGGWRFQVGSDYAAIVSRLWEERPPRLSRAMLETLALICYRQPLARSDIEAVRGVSVSTAIIRSLEEYNWIKVVGHREMPGRPALYGTTTQFLDDFGVQRLADLPPLAEIRDPEALDAAVDRLQAVESDLSVETAVPPETSEHAQASDGCVSPDSPAAAFSDDRDGQSQPH